MFEPLREIWLLEKDLSRLCSTMHAGALRWVQLAVVNENKAACRLYGALGFVEYGYEKRALKQDGQYYDEVLMVKFLDEGVS